MKVALKQTRLGLRNSTTRIPFRYGQACLTACPQAMLSATVEIDGRGSQTGYAGDCLPPSWFDKSPQKDYRQQIDDMLAAIGAAQREFNARLAQPAAFFPAWLASLEAVHAFGEERGFPPLLSSFGVSMVERAVMDAMARAAGMNLHVAVRENIFDIAPGQAHASLDEFSPADWLPERPRDWVWVRHTVGLGDPLTVGEIAPGDRLGDGYPQALEEYIEQTGTRYFKIKVANDLDADLERLRAIAALVEKHRGGDYRVTIDGNEQFTTPDEVETLVDAILTSPPLARLWENLLAIEQPLARHVALDADRVNGWRLGGQRKPVIIDESDGRLESYGRAVELGYRGVSSKNCKGPIKSILNAGLTWLHNRQSDDRYVMTGEDLCSVGIVPVQSDLALAAMLGLDHVERNGHHYHPGLSYLPEAQQRAALDKHGDFYGEQPQSGRNSGHSSVIRPHVVDGTFRIKSLQCPGFGFGVEPDMAAYTPAEQWQFESLGLET